MIIESLSLDGACRIVNKSTKRLRVEASQEGGTTIRNEGYEVVPLNAEEDKQCDEVTRMRGFYLKKKEELVIELTDGMELDGVTFRQSGEREGEVIYSWSCL